MMVKMSETDVERFRNLQVKYKSLFRELVEYLRELSIQSLDMTKRKTLVHEHFPELPVEDVTFLLFFGTALAE